MIAKLYTSHLEKQLSRAHYLVLMLVIGILQKVKSDAAREQGSQCGLGEAARSWGSPRRRNLFIVEPL
ncbi:hypothetical protein [Moorena producens]|uniref:hypothetical protein n=1 Tax=Moorena producens TaxID=1155739 RepID=UPI003C715A89